MKIISKWLALLALLAGPFIARADAVTYDFTGTITKFHRDLQRASYGHGDKRHIHNRYRQRN